MKKPQNLPALIFSFTFLAMLVSRMGKADVLDLVFYGLAVCSMLLFFVASNLKPKDNQKKNPSRVRVLLAGGLVVTVTACIASMFFFL